LIRPGKAALNSQLEEDWIRQQLTRGNHSRYGKDFPGNYKLSIGKSSKLVAFKYFSAEIHSKK
jgi:hypothetical protein